MGNNQLSDITTIHRPRAGAVRSVLSILVLVHFALGLVLTFYGASSAQDQSNEYAAVARLIGSKDAIIVSDGNGRILLSRNADRLRIPASTLKVLTSLAALHHLGADFRYFTDFYLDDSGNLIIKGYGDPLLISEVVADIAGRLKPLLPQIRDIVLDDSYFAQPLTIPGVSSSAEPYDAPNGALCVNFNTVFFTKEAVGYVSAEPQTPLLGIAKDRVRASGLDEGRIVLSHHGGECTLYAGQLFRYFFEQQGIGVSGEIRMGKLAEYQATRIYRYVSPFTLEDIVAKLLEHSNNFITNQLLITAGVQAHQPPGTLSKGVRVMQRYARQHLRLKDIQITEGSGISRRNRITARAMQTVLEAFFPYRHLMRHNGREYYKTGTLRGISTRAGYIESADQGHYRYTVFINSPGKSAAKVVRLLMRELE